MLTENGFQLNVMFECSTLISLIFLGSINNLKTLNFFLLHQPIHEIKTNPIQCQPSTEEDEDKILKIVIFPVN